PNLLLLDEPTNHLDLEMRHALTLALSEYEGAVVLVSHDRHLLRTVCDNFCLVADGGLKPFDGDLDDYRKWLDQPHEEKGREKVSPPDTAKAAPPPAPERKPSGKARALEKEIGQLEKRMAQLAAEKQKLDARLADPALYQPAAKADLQACQQRQIEVAGELAGTEAAWLAAQEKLEKSE
ncbi:MAG: ABC transporter, partial [Burkholderiales bacterium]|nr:ABC transporter [Burkholderiales bacterium]